IPEAVTLELGPLATLEPDSEANFGAAPSPSAQLFLLHAALAGARFPLDAPPLTDVERIVRELEGIPLAIELAAARVPSLGVAGVLALCGRTGEGPGAELSRPPLQRSALHDALRSAWNSLTPLEQRLLAARAAQGSRCSPWCANSRSLSGRCAASSGICGFVTLPGRASARPRSNRCRGSGNSSSLDASRQSPTICSRRSSVRSVPRPVICRWR